MKSAIIIVDVQRDFFRAGRLYEHKDGLTKSINALTDFGRQHTIPIIWVRQEFKEDLSDAFLGIRKGLSKPVTIAGSSGAKLLPELHVGPDDYEIIKKRYSAFFETGLNDLLKQLDIDTLILGGVNTHACIRMAAIDAYQRDYTVFLSTDCIDSYDEEHHRVTLKYLSGIITQPKTNTELFTMLQAE